MKTRRSVIRGTPAFLMGLAKALSGERHVQAQSCLGYYWTKECNGVCVDTLRDPYNCGRCGNVCSTGSCLAGQCSGYQGGETQSEPDVGSGVQSLPETNDNPLTWGIDRWPRECLGKQPLREVAPHSLELVGGGLLNRSGGGPWISDLPGSIVSSDRVYSYLDENRIIGAQVSSVTAASPLFVAPAIRWLKDWVSENFVLSGQNVILDLGADSDIPFALVSDPLEHNVDSNFLIWGYRGFDLVMFASASDLVRLRSLVRKMAVFADVVGC